MTLHINHNDQYDDDTNHDDHNDDHTNHNDRNDDHKNHDDPNDDNTNHNDGDDNDCQDDLHGPGVVHKTCAFATRVASGTSLDSTALICIALYYFALQGIIMQNIAFIMSQL